MIQGCSNHFYGYNMVDLRMPLVEAHAFAGFFYWFCSHLKSGLSALGHSFPAGCQRQDAWIPDTNDPYSHRYPRWVICRPHWADESGERSFPIRILLRSLGYLGTQGSHCSVSAVHAVISKLINCGRIGDKGLITEVLTFKGKTQKC